MSTAAGPGLIETMRMRGDGTIDRLALHLSRLERSAQALAIPHDARAVESAIGALEATGTDQRIRLELSPDGDLHVNVYPYPGAGSGQPWRLAIAATRLDSREPLLRHKTTFRAHYVQARQEYPADRVDEVLLLNQAEAVCEGTITSVFVRPAAPGPLLTPALACGLLDGVLRREMIANGQAREAELSVADLLSARDLYVGNSLRGLIPAILIE